MKNNVGLFLAKRAHLSPRLEAYVDSDTGARYLYTELNERANRTANALRKLGVGKGDRVALLMMNSVEFMESFFAIAKDRRRSCVPTELAPGARRTRLHPRKTAAHRTLDVRHRVQPTRCPNYDARGSRRQQTIDTWVHVSAAHERAALRDRATRRSFSKSRFRSRTSECDRLGRRRAVHHVHVRHDGNAQGRRSTPTTSTMLGQSDDRSVPQLKCATATATWPALPAVPRRCTRRRFTGNVHRGLTNVVVRNVRSGHSDLAADRAGEDSTSCLAVPAMLNFMLQVSGKGQGRSSLETALDA